ncbi:type VI secretion system Vgr family protein [Shewanella khirikhana]|uniref:Phage-related baseplate assembly protein n=1 Tax=Shewanella khirikhana TaxID=1965282 RepID=A0ABM7DAG0_9GAMM|nr:type VI secretion system tip protein TssI/VgrG [Shewanella khirikhana]AZQ10863.1 Phage-related baseplate assembly protein [Shewanella khirikhana]
MYHLGSGLRFHFKAEGLAEEVFSPLSFTVDEGLSSDMHGELDLLSRDPSMTPEAIVDRSGVLSVWRDGKAIRRFHGVVTAFERRDTGHHHSQYRLVMNSNMARLKLRHNSRIFQQQSLKQILETLLAEMGIADYAFNWDTRHETEQREYCVQYRESDFEFIQRLTAESGVFWLVTQGNDNHSIVFCDATSRLTASGLALPYNALAGGKSEQPFVRRFAYKKQLASGSVALKDYSFKKPAYSFLQQQIGKRLEHQQMGSDALYEHYDYPGRYKDDSQGKLITQSRLHARRAEAEVARGESDIPQLAAGFKYGLQDHPERSFNRDWLLLSVRHSGEQGAAAEEANTEAPTRFHNQFRALEANLPWQANIPARPMVGGPQIATVVGPKGEEIFCDEHGRVKVQFPWDRYGQANENSSCWVRVSQGWAGAEYGFLAIPRIGHEVIVSFLEGDPDQPIITGRTYHVVNTPPYLLPNHKTRTVLKTQTHKGEGFNELRFEDEASREQIYLHAQKDMDRVVNHIRRTEIGVDEHLSVGNDSVAKIKASRHCEIGKDELIRIGQDRHETLGRNLLQKIGGAIQRYVAGGMISRIDGGRQTKIAASDHTSIGADWLIKVGNETGLKAKTIVLDAGDQLTIKGPGGFIKLDSGGVTISGSKVKINEGGSPGKATEPKPVDPEAPASPTAPTAADRR